MQYIIDFDIVLSYITSRLGDQMWVAIHVYSKQGGYIHLHMK